MYIIYVLCIVVSLDNCSGKEENILMGANKNLEDIITPVRAETLKNLLEEAGYDQEKIQYLFNGFKEGFSLEYDGPLKKVKRSAPNLKLRVGSKVELWNKVMKEVQLGRYVGPFEDPPYEYYVQSPIGLVSKDKGLKTRLIFHLSYPRNGGLSQLRDFLKKKCSVKYPDFEEAIKLCIQEGECCSVAK